MRTTHHFIVKIETDYASAGQFQYETTSVWAAKNRFREDFDGEWWFAHVTSLSVVEYNPDTKAETEINEPRRVWCEDCQDWGWVEAFNYLTNEHDGFRRCHCIRPLWHKRSVSGMPIPDVFVPGDEELPPF